MADFLAMFKDPMEKLGRMDELQGVLAEANVDIVSTDAIANMLEFVKTELPHLERVRLWWDELQGGVGITPVGVAIGYSNAKRLGKLIGISELSSMIEN